MTADELRRKLEELAPYYTWQVRCDLHEPREPVNLDPPADAPMAETYVITCTAPNARATGEEFRYVYRLAEMYLVGSTYLSADSVIKHIAQYCVDAITRGMVAWRPQFPILLTPKQRDDHPDWPRHVPWSLVAPHEAQAKTNHGQGLEMLARRGGLSPSELLCVLKDERWGPWLGPNSALVIDAYAMDEIIAWLAKHNAAPVPDLDPLAGL